MGGVGPRNSEVLELRELGGFWMCSGCFLAGLFQFQMNNERTLFSILITAHMAQVLLNDSNQDSERVLLELSRSFCPELFPLVFWVTSV